MSLSKSNKSHKSGRSSPSVQSANVRAERDVLRAAAATHASELEELRASLVKVTTERDLAVTVSSVIVFIVACFGLTGRCQTSETLVGERSNIAKVFTQCSVTNC
jgi:hypothetical protein